MTWGSGVQTGIAEAPKQGRRSALLWLIGAAVLGTLLFIASARGRPSGRG